MASNALTPERALAELTDGPRRPLYLFLGEQADWKEGVVAELRERLSGRFLVHGVGPDESLPETLSRARTVPMLDEGYLFVLRDGERYPAEALERLVAYLGDPSSFATLVLLASAPDRRRTQWKKLLELAAVVDFAAPRADTLAGWVREAARKAELAIAPEAVEFLVSQAGARPDEVRERVALLALYLAPGEPAIRRHCEELFVAVREESVWQLVDAMVVGNGRQALAVAATLLDAGESPHQLLAFLYGRFRLACYAQYHCARQGNLEDLAKTLGTRPFALQKLLPWGRDWSEDARRKVRRLFAAADRRMKTSGGTPEHILEHLVCQLAHA